MRTNEYSEAISRLRRAAIVAGLAAAAFPLAGCNSGPTAIMTDIPLDYRARHPIEITRAPIGIEIYASGAQLDRVTRARVEELAKLAREENQSVIEVLFPRGASNEAQQRSALPAIRAALSAGGAQGYVNVGVYPVGDPRAMAPVRLSFNSVRARVASNCGEWPDDLASGSSLQSWSNKPYWNMGCSYQTMFAAQVANSSDLVEPRAVGNGDVEMRIRAIGKVRQGADPASNWGTKTTSIGSVGGG
jgi:pilus assembly protein CpaD